MRCRRTFSHQAGELDLYPGPQISSHLHTASARRNPAAVLFVAELRFLREAFGAVILISGGLWGGREKYLK